MKTLLACFLALPSIALSQKPQAASSAEQAKALHEQAIKRMVRLRGVTLTPDDARSILKYLSTYHGLAPEEAKPVMYYAEHKIQDEINIPSDDVRGACANCHPMARPLSWRRS